MNAICESAVNVQEKRAPLRPEAKTVEAAALMFRVETSCQHVSKDDQLDEDHRT